MNKEIWLVRSDTRAAWPDVGLKSFHKLHIKKPQQILLKSDAFYSSLESCTLVAKKFAKSFQKSPNPVTLQGHG